MQRAVVALVALVGCLVGGVTTTLLIWDDDVEALSPRPIAVLAPVTQDATTTTTPARLSLDWRDGPVVAAPPWSGTITRVGVTVGDELVEGTVVAHVDEQPVRVLQTSIPLYRPVGPGTSGTDVLEAGRYLERRGLLAAGSATETYDDELRRAITQMQTDHGLPMQTKGTLLPEWFVWVPETMTVSTVEISVGGPAPAAGSPVLKANRTLTAARVVAAEDGVEPRAPASDDVLSFVDDATGATWPLTAGSLDVDMSGIEPNDLLSMQGDDEEISGTLTQERSRGTLYVPSSSVETGRDGRYCVWLSTDGADEYESRPVDIADGRPGTVAIVSGLDEGDVVLANRSELGVSSCHEEIVP